MKNLLPKFIFKFLTKYFLYGYLCIIGFGLCGVVFYRISHLGFPYKILCLIPIAVCLVIIPCFVRICCSTNTKWRFYKISCYRFATRKFSDEWFKYEMGEPCMRLIIKDLCYENNCRGEYKMLCQKYVHDGFNFGNSASQIFVGAE